MKSTTRHSWRVVWILSIVALIVFSVALFMRIIETRDLTSNFRPSDTSFTIRMIKTPQTITLSDKKIGNTQLFENHPWRIKDLIKWSDREFSIHVTADGKISATIDKNLDEPVKTALKNSGFTVVNSGKTTLITKEEGINQKKIRFSLKLVNPSNDGEVLVYNEKTTSSAINISEKGIILKALTNIEESPSRFTFEEDSELLAQLWLTKEQTLSFSNFLPTNSSFTSLIESKNLYLTVAKDKRGIAYNILINESNISIDELAEIGQEIINLQSLSTSEWTMIDSSTIDEITVNEKEITSKITSSENNSFITLTNTKGDVVRITKTPNNISISNRNISLSPQKISKSTTCMNSSLFLNPKILSGKDKLTNILQTFHSIAIKKNKTIFCW